MHHAGMEQWKVLQCEAPCTMQGTYYTLFNSYIYVGTEEGKCWSPKGVGGPWSPTSLSTFYLWRV